MIAVIRIGAASPNLATGADSATSGTPGAETGTATGGVARGQHDDED
jgi:hypothetical protein